MHPQGLILVQQTVHFKLGKYNWYLYRQANCPILSLLSLYQVLDGAELLGDRLGGGGTLQDTAGTQPLRPGGDGGGRLA